MWGDRRSHVSTTVESLQNVVLAIRSPNACCICSYNRTRSNAAHSSSLGTDRVFSGAILFSFELLHLHPQHDSRLPLHMPLVLMHPQNRGSLDVPLDSCRSSLAPGSSLGNLWPYTVGTTDLSGPPATDHPSQIAPIDHELTISPEL